MPRIASHAGAFVWPRSLWLHPRSASYLTLARNCERPTYRRPQQALSISYYFSQCWEGVRLPVIAWWTCSQLPKWSHVRIIFGLALVLYAGGLELFFFGACWSRHHTNGRLWRYSRILLFLHSIIKWWCDEGLAIFGASSSQPSIILTLRPACDLDVDTIVVWLCRVICIKRNEQRSRLQVC